MECQSTCCSTFAAVCSSKPQYPATQEPRLCPNQLGAKQARLAAFPVDRIHPHIGVDILSPHCFAHALNHTCCPKLPKTPAKGSQTHLPPVWGHLVAWRHAVDLEKNSVCVIAFEEASCVPRCVSSNTTSGMGDLPVDPARQ